jgi:sulfotransferase family protein
MDAERLLAEAREQTGLEDFGHDSFREGLDRLLHALDTEATLNALGEVALPHLITRLLTTRLQVEDWYRRHPEIDDEVIEAPLIGLGLPRTGSTALSFLLAEDPRARSLRLWESGRPCPPPSTVEPPDPRIEQTAGELAMQKEINPRLAALVPAEVSGPMECQELMALDFRAHYFPAFAHMPSYTEWLLDADLTTTYRYERRVLKLLQWGEPGDRPWRLKCPSHLLWLDALDEVFPDARFVMTHRDPTDVMVSVADLYGEVGNQFSEDVDLHYVGRLNVEQWSTAMERVLAFREAHGDERFYDIDFRAMALDPLGEVRGLYDWLGEPVGDEFAEGMARWWRENNEDREANVHPDAAAFGLDLDEVRTRFAAYTAKAEQWTRRSA